MKLPEITQQILDEFGEVAYNDTQLIVWVDTGDDHYPQWTQTAVDFARLVAQGEKPKFLEVNGEQRRVVDVDVMVDIAHMQKRIAELEAENKQLKDWIGHSLVMSDYPNADAMRTEIERMRHEANEWADAAVNGLQWLRNIRDGISSADEAIPSIEDNIRHCHEVEAKKP